MAKIIPFKAIRPTRDKAYLVSSKPAYTYKKHILEAKLEHNPYTFLHVINPEYRADHKTEPNSIERFQHVKDKFGEFYQEGIFMQDDKDSFYIYRKITPNNTYIGLISGIAVDDYLNGNIKVHEHTLTQREETFKMYLDVCQFNAEPVLMMYKENKNINAVINKYFTTRSEYEFTTSDKIKHDLWVVDDPNDIATLIKEFETIDKIYIADGHHRSASSVLYAKSLREKYPDLSPNHKSNYFLAYLIPETGLNIIAFNRVSKTLNGLSTNEFLNKLKKHFTIEEKAHPFSPGKPHEFSMYLDKKWYLLQVFDNIINENDVVERLDTRILFRNVISPILGIEDPKTDSRIDFIEGTKGSEGLQQVVDSGQAKVAFGLYPVTIEQLKAVADSNNFMPPKSTYIEPKMRTGLTIYSLEG